MGRIGFHIVVVGALTLLSLLGGAAWLLALSVRHRWFEFPLFYAALSLGALWVAPLFGRVPLSCAGDTLRVQSWAYCALNRQYVVPEMQQVLKDMAEALDEQFPGTVTLGLDAGFPFANGFPLLPHLSHDDGRKADIAFFYRDSSGYLPAQTRSPFGYFAFEDGTTECARVWPSLRWDLKPLQGLWADLELEPQRTRAALQWLSQDGRVGKVFIEPHLHARLGVKSAKFRFQGCRAARNDDHIHLQL